MNNLEERLRILDIEDFIWVIYIGIIILSFYSNILERDYLKNNDICSRDKYRVIMIIIFLILIIIYLYNVIENVRNLDGNKYQYWALIASILILISGIIYLIIIIRDIDVNVEIAFN